MWQGIALTTSWTLRNFWSFYFEVNLRGRYADDREMGDGSALQFPASGGAVASLSTDPRRRVMFAWSGSPNSAKPATAPISRPTHS